MTCKGETELKDCSVTTCADITELQEEKWLMNTTCANRTDGYATHEVFQPLNALPRCKPGPSTYNLTCSGCQNFVGTVEDYQCSLGYSLNPYDPPKQKPIQKIACYSDLTSNISQVEPCLRELYEIAKNITII